MDAEASVNSLTAAINSFSSAALNSTQIVNRLANVDAAFAVSSNDLAEAIRRVASTAQGANVKFNELIAVVTSAQQVTARGGNVIGNSLKTIFTRIQRTEVINQLNDLGVAVRQANGEMRPAMKVLGDLAKRYDSLAGAEKAYTAELVGGVYQMNILKAILKDLSSEYSIYGQALKVANDTTDQALQRNKELNKTLSALINESTQNLTKFGAEMGKVTFEPVIRKVLTAFNSMQKKTDFFGDVGKFLGFDEGKAADFGGKMAKGIFESIGNFLSGPGLILLGTVIFKLLGDFGKFVSKATADFVGMNKSAQEQAAIQKQINQYLAQNPGLLDAVRKGEMSVLNVEKQLLDTMKLQVREKAALDQITRGMASRMSAAGVGASIDKGAGTYHMTASRGYVPQFNKRASREVAGAINGGYMPGAMRTFNQPGEGNILYNSAEERKRFRGMRQSAIMPPKNSVAGKEYKESFVAKLGFDPYKTSSSGFVPNMMGVFTSMGLGTAGPVSNMKNNKTMRIAGSTLIKGSPKGLQDVLGYALRPGEDVTFSFAGGNQVMSADERRRIPTRGKGESLGKYNVRKGAAQESIFAGRRGFSTAFGRGKAGVQHPNLPVDLKGPRGAVEVKSPEFVKSGKAVDPAKGGRLTSKDLISLFGKTLYENNSSSARQIRSRLSAAGPSGAHLLEKFNNYLSGQVSRREGEIYAYTGQRGSLSAVNSSMGFDTRAAGGTRYMGFVPQFRGMHPATAKMNEVAGYLEQGMSGKDAAARAGVAVGSLTGWSKHPNASPRFKAAHSASLRGPKNKHALAGENFEKGLGKYFGLGMDTTKGGEKQARLDFIGSTALPLKGTMSKRKKIAMGSGVSIGDAHNSSGHGSGAFLPKMIEGFKIGQKDLMAANKDGVISMPNVGRNVYDITRSGKEGQAKGESKWGVVKDKLRRYTSGWSDMIGDDVLVRMPYQIDKVNWPPKGKARGFVPNFYTPKDKQDALLTEQLMGAKRPEFREHPFPHVADAATQPTFKDVLKDHPEGLKKAIHNSGKLQARLGGGQGYKGKIGAAGFVPNFQGGGTTGMDMTMIAASMGMAAMGAQQMRESFDELKKTAQDLAEAEKNAEKAVTETTNAEEEAKRDLKSAGTKYKDEKRQFETAHAGDADYLKKAARFDKKGGVDAMDAGAVRAGAAARGVSTTGTDSEIRERLKRKLAEELEAVKARTKDARAGMESAKQTARAQGDVYKAKKKEKQAAEEAARNARKANAQNMAQTGIGGGGAMGKMRGAANFVGKNAFGAQMMATTGAGIARGFVSEDNQKGQGIV